MFWDIILSGYTDSNTAVSLYHSLSDSSMDNLLIAKFKDIDRIASSRDITKHTGFLSEAEIADLYAVSHDFSGSFFLSGGYPEAGRQMAIWNASYEDPKEVTASLIACLRFRPLNRKFSDELSHRDVLGALMHLSIERERIGDICLRKEDRSAFIFCEKALSELILSELTRIRHTEVLGEEVPLSACDFRPEFSEEQINVASERLDALVAAVWRVSRSEAAGLISGEKVMVDGRIAGNLSKKIPEGAKISVRGYGKFIYDGFEAESRKGRLFVKIRRYV